MCNAAKYATVLLYSSGTDRFQEDLTKNTNRVFYFDEGARATTKLIAKAYSWWKGLNLLSSIRNQKRETRKD
jgi:hypothetical protein